MSIVLLPALCAAVGYADEPAGSLAWEKDRGVVWTTQHACVQLDANEQLRGPVVRVLPSGEEYRLSDPQVHQVSPTQIATFLPALTSRSCRVSRSAGISLSSRKLRASDWLSHSRSARHKPGRLTLKSNGHFL